jgi:hypothetical protein
MHKAANAWSRRTKKRVAHSDEELTLSGNLMRGATVSFGLVAPPQVNPERLHVLALMHLKAFLYLITYRKADRAGGYAPCHAIVAADAFLSDWGNQRLVEFAKMARPWKQILHGVAAEGFFKVVLRADPQNESVLAFALEWNRSYRVAGFIGEETQIQDYVNRLPDLGWKGFDSNTRYRQETPLDPAADILFEAGK